MSRKAVWGIIIALFTPLAAYFILKSFTDRDVAMPRHYLPDSTIVTTKDGKQYIDTVWHRIPDFKLTNHMNQQIGWSDLEGKVVVANFFFTRCPTICPALTSAMRTLQQSVKSADRVGTRDAQFVHFLSFSIDPERDSVANLKWWADRFQVDPQNWWLLTGDKKTIYDLSVKEMRVPAEDGGEVDSNFVHTDVFVLIDKNRNIRGYYHALNNEKVNGGFVMDTASMSQLSRDVVLLALEKDPNRKFFLAGKFPLIIIVLVLAAAGVFVLLQVIKREK